MKKNQPNQGVNNPILIKFLKKVESEFPNHKLTTTEGSKFIKIFSTSKYGGVCIWGFISRYDGVYLGKPIKKGDLMKPASMASPAKNSRGNIIDGTESYTEYGPNYMFAIKK